MALTGRTRYRVGLFKKLILQVEYSYGTRPTMGPNIGKILGPHHGWRDATVEDMQAIDALRSSDSRGVLFQK